MSDRVVLQLLTIIDQAYDHKSWHGTNLRGSIRGVSADLAARRPAPGRHNVWEIVVHCAYWKYAVWRKLTGAKRGSFALKGSNWFHRPVDASESAWRADIALLGETHRALRAAIALMSANDLRAKIKSSPFDHAARVSGIAAHDVYHAGQIQLVKGLVR